MRNELTYWLKGGIHEIVMRRLQNLSEMAAAAGNDSVLRPAIELVEMATQNINLAGFAAKEDVANLWRRLRGAEDGRVEFLADLTRDILLEIGKERLDTVQSELADAMEVFTAPGGANNDTVADSEVTNRQMDSKAWKAIFKANPWFMALVLIELIQIQATELATLGLKAEVGKK